MGTYAIALRGADDPSRILMLIDDRGDADEIAASLRLRGNDVAVKEVPSDISGQLRRRAG